ncbi:SAUR-like auxin-responsive protein family [Striga hermonthica]|uniref:SAUR-like auxin-responsive protein family n=1 Tax=Striga hermonthica TaxID=68872 RepID=A0A9N7RMW8_STRHE|nr:SAUR-like auxin-responsive protein family [Striga hermonthica]
MAIGGKLTKIKSVLKKMQSFRLGRTSSSSSSSSDGSFESIAAAKDLYPVYVGKSRRRYLVSANVVDSPLFRELVDRRSGGGGEEDAVVIGCEVVLFEHLLWMLENADPQPESPCELAKFYAY